MPFPDFCADPLSILSHPDLVVMVDGKYYSWQVAAPLIMSAVVYLQVLPQRTKDKIIKEAEPKKVCLENAAAQANNNHTHNVDCVSL